MICERCNALDGRHTDEYTLKGGVQRVFCDPCARLTATVHDITPAPLPEAQEAEAEEEEAEPEAPEAPDAEEPEGQESEGEPESEEAPPRRRRGN